MTAQRSSNRDINQMIFILVAATVLAVTSLGFNTWTWFKLQGGIREQQWEMDRLAEARVGDVPSLEADLAARFEEMNADLLAGAATSTATGLLALGMGLIAFLLFRRVLREKKRSERFSASVLKAQKARRQKDSFVAMMSHEIRTPLNAMIGFSQLLQQEAKGDLTKRYAASIIEGGQSLLRLINDVLDLSKLEAGMMGLSLEPTDLRELVTFCDRLFREQCVAKGLAFECRCDPEIPRLLLLDAVRLRQVVLNLLGNAVKFTDAGMIRLSVTGHRSVGVEGQWDIQILVRDTGRGIPEADREKIFEPFVQSEGTIEVAEGAPSGTGLGLSIVKRFLGLMGGAIQVESRVGEGSVMTVSLPGVATAERLADQQIGPDDEVDFNGLAPVVIVAADDNPTNRELLTEIFRGTHHTLHCAATGDEALRMVEQISPDLVLLDIRMPGLDGIAVAELIRKDPANSKLPIIAVTAGSLGDDSSDENSLFDERVRKPFTQVELHAALARFLPVVKPIENGQNSAGVSEGLPDGVRDELEDLKVRIWPGVRNRMKVSEVQAFAERLAGLGARHHCKDLEDYARDLTAATETFSIQKMTNLLESFPSWLEHSKRVRQ